MDFSKTLRSISEKFNQASIQYALIGGFALYFWGYPRGTNDLDFIVLAEDKERAKKLLETLGFKVWRETENVAHYESESAIVDFIYAKSIYGKKLLERACENELNGIKFKVAKAEDIIGLKVQSFANNPSRWLKEMADIENLLIENKGKLDLELIEEYFKLFQLEKEWKLLLERYNEVNK